MTSLDAAWLLSRDRDLPSAEDLLALAARLVDAGQIELAASACDAAFGLAPGDTSLVEARAALLDRLQVHEHGLVFRYVPAGPFLMGADDGDPDERPVHPVELGSFWLTDVPITWSAYHALMGWPPPPDGMPPEDPAKTPEKGGIDQDRFSLWNDHKVRRQYCETETVGARDWHAHAPETEWERAGQIVKGREIFGDVARVDPARPWTYDDKPMIAVSWEQAADLGKKLTTADVTYRLPTEAEWEKAARGGLVGCPYPWGDAPPTPERCDFGRFEAFSIRPPRSFPPNGYGLFAMSGGVREWVRDGYDALAYAESPLADPTGPAVAKERVLRGGSWADCPWAVRVSFRTAVRPRAYCDPTIGFRLCRIRRLRS